MRSKTIVLLAISVLPLAAAAAADPVAPGGVADLSGPRSAGLGGSIGIASGNDAVYVNPAALAARRRYSAEAQLWMERRGSENTTQVFSGSVADALSSPVAAAMAFGRVSDGVETGSLFHLAMAGPLARGFYVGATGKYYDLKGFDRVVAATADAGLFWEASDFVAVGVTGYNLIQTSHPGVLPRAIGAGISVGSDRAIEGTFDWRGDLDRLGKTSNRYAFGVEMLAGDVAPLRASYIIDETLDTRWWSVGAGLVSPEGGGIDVAYRQSVTDRSARVVTVSVKLQFAQ